MWPGHSQHERASINQMPAWKSSSSTSTAATGVEGVRRLARSAEEGKGGVTQEKGLPLALKSTCAATQNILCPSTRGQLPEGGGGKTRALAAPNKLRQQTKPL